MVDLYEGPSREGVRGGLEQFSWDSIKSQIFKDRECYLGQSVQVGIQGKFGKFFRNDWWFLDRNTPGDLEEEVEFQKRFEEELMQEALNAKPKRLLLLKSELTQEQKAALKDEFALEDKKKKKLAKRNKKKRKKIQENEKHQSDSVKKKTKYKELRHNSNRKFKKSSLERF